MPRTPSPANSSTNQLTFGAEEATRKTTADIRFRRRKDFTRNSVRHNDQCRKWRVAVGLTLICMPLAMGRRSLELLLRLCHSSREYMDMEIQEYNKENTGLLDAPYQLAYRPSIVYRDLSK
jgi:hypothetical protein